MTIASLGWYPIKNGTAAKRSIGEVTVVIGEASMFAKLHGSLTVDCVEKVIAMWKSIL
jgi:hypothetical protein